MRQLAARLHEKTVPIAVAAVAIAAPLVISSDRWTRVFALALVYVVLASGLNLLVGYAGLLDLGYIAFFTIGAYYASIISVDVAINSFHLDPTSLWWLFLLNLPIAALIALLFGIVLGYPTLRARGDYLAIMTLAFGEIVRQVAINWVGLTHGPFGITNVPPPSIPGMQLLTPRELYYTALAIAAIAIFTISRIVASYVGRSWSALREDEVVAESVGIPTRRFKLLAYATGAFYAGLVGAFFADMQQFVNPDSFRLENNLTVLLLVIVGGAGTVWGPVLGAVGWIVLQDWAGDLTLVQDHPELRLMLLAVLLLVCVRFLPNGIVGRRLRKTHDGRAPAAAQHAPQEELLPDRSDRAGAELLRASGVSCRFGGVRALNDVGFGLHAGEVLSIIGPNGAGKTTLLNVLSGIQAPTAGAVVLDGTPLARRSPSRINELGIARTFQNIRLIPQATVVENVLVAAHCDLRANPLQVVARSPHMRAREDAAEARARALIAYVGLADTGEQTATALSYGDQRRVEIARALMSRPSVLLLDEPAAGMNAIETLALKQLIARISATGTAIALIEHDMELVMDVSDRIVVLDHGELIAEGTPAEVQSDERVVQAYLGVPA
ncbi:MAG TPA: branched-chain amino acid ABC transporter ATP-binding protein/permease [Conexibacter sp.]|nr:branched-chain amino acid ABC transporter ATP-binding protein/permease [Conexibacter sp.]